MGLYNFKEQFVPFILSGAKTHTIRAVRRHPDKPGNTLYLYTGLRTKKAKLLMCVDCVKVERIEIDTTFEMGGPDRGKMLPQVWIGEPGPMYCAVPRELVSECCGHVGDTLIRNGDCVRLSLDEREQLAHRDGFSSFAEMMTFWTTPKNRLPFIGNIIHWRYEKANGDKK